MRLGIFGGSFDPVHYGHLLLAEICREARELDEVWFVPAAVAPHKQGNFATAVDDRIAMLQLAIGGHSSLKVSRIEADRGGVSFTAETLRQVRDEQPEADIELLMGADTLADLPNWRDPQVICELATPVVVGRPDSPPVDYTCLADLVDADRLESFQEAKVEIPQIDLSSSEIRRRIASGQSIRYQTPRAVEQYIRAQGLYRE